MTRQASRRNSIPELTGLEPATSAVTGRRSNQLSYNSSEKAVKLELNRGGFNRKFLRKQRCGGAGQSRFGSPGCELLPTELFLFR